MAENLIIENGDKAAKYAALVPQIRALLDGENDEIARMANAVAALQQTFGWLWTGFLSRGGR